MSGRNAGNIVLTGIAIALVTAGGVATAAPSPAQRFTVRADLSPSVHAQAAGSGLEIDSHLSAIRVPATLSGSSFALTAKLAASPLGCLDDLIFYDGFEVIPTR